MCARETRTAFSNFLQKANAINELSKYTAPPPTPRTPGALAAVTVVDSATSYTLMGTKILTPSDHMSHSAINLNLSEIVS